MARKQEAHEEDETSPPSLTIDRLLKFALDKYTDRNRADNHIWGSSLKREEDFVALSAELNSLKGNLKLQAKIIKKQHGGGGGGGGGGGPKTPSGGPPEGKGESHKAKAAKKAQWASECKALKKVPPTSPRQTVRTFTKAEHPGFSANSKPQYWCPTHLMWCVHTSDQCDLKKKQEAAAAASKASKSGYNSKAKRDASGNTKDQAMVAMLDYFSNEGADSDSDDEE
jgi:hypothetical protein